MTASLLLDHFEICLQLFEDLCRAITSIFSADKTVMRSLYRLGSLLQDQRNDAERAYRDELQSQGVAL